MDNYIELIENGKKIIFDAQTGLLSHNPKYIEQFKLKNNLHGHIDVPGTDHEIQGFTFVLTTKCNLNCKYCYSITQNKPLSMKKDDPVKILAHYIREDAKVIIIHFFGGEPTLEMETVKNTVNYLKTIKDKTIYLRISTNGFVKKDDLDYLIDNRFLIAVSNDGTPNKNSILAKRVKGNVVEKTIKYLVERDALFNIRCTITQDNVLSLAESVSYWKSIGVKHAHVEPYHPIGLKDESELLPDVSTYVSSFKKMLDAAEKEKFWISSGVFMNLLTPSTYFCTGASGRFKVFNPDGSITSCYRVQSFDNKIKDFFIGNWKEEIEKPHKRSKFISNYNKLVCHSGESMEDCKNCQFLLLCGGGCLMRNLTQAGSIEKVDKWICAVKKELLEDAIIRTWNATQAGEKPIVFGRFVFEYNVFNKPSIGLSVFNNMEKEEKINGDFNVIDIYKALGINRSVEKTVYKKIARAECI